MNFKFLSYYFNPRLFSASFTYQGIDGIIFTEKIQFAKPDDLYINWEESSELVQLIDRATFLAFILIGTSYYKTHPTPQVSLDLPIDEWQAEFFNRVYQEGLSQYAFENGLTRDQLAHFQPRPDYVAPPAISEYYGKGIISLQSGGKDSILVAELLKEREQDFLAWYVSSTDQKTYPSVIDQVLPPEQYPIIAVREIDLDHLQQSNGLNGHVPVTYILQSIALIQAILLNKRSVLTSIGHEGNEPHSWIGDLPVNHQWSKTWDAEQLFAEYVRRYISPNLKIGSPIRNLSETAIAEQFIRKCWEKYGYSFSSCNEANYKQKSNNTKLAWCGHCAKCANSYLLFSPFLAAAPLQSLFNGIDLYASYKDNKLMDNFKGLLGVDGVTKPFECVGSIDELRTAYHHRQPDYGKLPFDVPAGNFDYRITYPMQPDLI
ncbi:hypothetical protein IKF76_01685 [Candidatus Saccharibacteria bacterium]|nr:hypothetical protein [Candidatus Saccharibacteria bacterium]